MIDIDRERHAAQHLRVGDPALVGAIDGEQDALRHVIGPPPLELTERHEPVLAR